MRPHRGTRPSTPSPNSRSERSGRGTNATHDLTKVAPPWYFPPVAKTWFPTVIFIFLAVFVAIPALPEDFETRERPALGDRPVNFAHRGASASAPENTLAAFDEAISAGAEALELDARMTRDGKIAVIHDEAVNRTTDGTGAVRGMTLTELRALDAGYRFGEEYRGLAVPTLEETLRRYPDTFVNVEIKGKERDAAEGVLEDITDARAESRVLVVSEDGGVIGRFRELSEGRIATGASRREVATFFLASKLRVAWALDPAYDSLQIPPEYKGLAIATPRFIAAAHGRNIGVDVWTINEAREMERLLDLGADGIMTDRPETLAEILSHRNAPTR